MRIYHLLQIVLILQNVASFSPKSRCVSLSGTATGPRRQDFNAEKLSIAELQEEPEDDVSEGLLSPLPVLRSLVNRRPECISMEGAMATGQPLGSLQTHDHGAQNAKHVVMSRHQSQESTDAEGMQSIDHSEEHGRTTNGSEEAPEDGLEAPESSLDTPYGRLLRDTILWERDELRFKNPSFLNFDNLSDEEVFRSHERLKREEEGVTFGEKVQEIFNAQKKPRQTAQWKTVIPSFTLELKTNQCRGCGVFLQTQREDKKGYVDLEILQRPHPVLCKRCSSMNSGGIFRLEGVALGQSAMEASSETVARLRNALSYHEKRSIKIVYIMDVLDMYFEKGLADLIIKRKFAGW